MTTLLILYVGSGLLLALLALPMIAGKVPPNSLYGFRTPSTVSNPELWYPVNRCAGKWLLFNGLATVIAALVLYLVPGLSVDSYSLVCLAVAVVGLGLTLWRSFRYLRSLQKEKR